MSVAGQKGLTPNVERAVLLALLDGLSSKEIALQLGRSRATIETYVRMLRSKYDARSRLQLVLRAVRNGLVASAREITNR